MKSLLPVGSSQDQTSPEVFSISRRQLLLLTAAGGAAGLAPTTVGAAQDTATPVPEQSQAMAVYPIPGTRTASPGTQITFRGVGLETLSPIEVVGSVSGVHPGIQLKHSDGAGISWVSDYEFLPGEDVTVDTRLDLLNGANGSFAFTVSRPVPLEAHPRRNPVADEAAVTHYKSRPGLVPPLVAITGNYPRRSPGYVFLSPKLATGRNGALIVDNKGEPVWFFPVEVQIEQVFDFRVSTYLGQPVLTWWQGVVVQGHGFGHWVLRDSSYQEIATVQIGNGFAGGDLHDLVITSRNTALIGTYATVLWDLTPVEGVEDGLVIDCIVQEIDIPTGAVMYEWHSLDFIALDESKAGVRGDNPEDPAFDHFHYNSVAEDSDGHFVVNARNTWAAYKIDRVTGAVIWRLGGTDSSFSMGEGAEAAYQHDARPYPDGTLSWFDNGGNPPVHEQSRGVILELDTEQMTATVLQEYLHPDKILAGSQGNMQILPGGNVIIGWGSEPLASEFTADGEWIGDWRLPKEKQSYRAYKFDWIGSPTELPAIAIETDTNALTLYASWNGATELAAWQVLSGASMDDLQELGEPVARDGFETMIPIEARGGSFAIRALDKDGRALGESNAIEV